MGAHPTQRSAARILSIIELDRGNVSQAPFGFGARDRRDGRQGRRLGRNSGYSHRLREVSSTNPAASRGE